MGFHHSNKGLQIAFLKKGSKIKFLFYSPGGRYDTPGSQFLLTGRQVWYPGESFFLALKNQELSNIEYILTYWSVAQAGSSDEKKLEVENLSELSL